MTIKYECDRCHQQFTDKKEVCEVTYEANFKGLHIEGVSHYCTKCSIYFNNAVNNVNNGTFDGVVKK